MRSNPWGARRRGVCTSGALLSDGFREVAEALSERVVYKENKHGSTASVLQKYIYLYYTSVFVFLDFKAAFRVVLWSTFADCGGVLDCMINDYNSSRGTDSPAAFIAYGYRRRQKARKLHMYDAN